MEVKNTSDLINFVSDKTGLTKAKSQEVLRAVIGGIVHSVSESKEKDSRLNVKDLGVFRKVHRKARKGVNPQDGSSITIAARNTVGFKPSQRFRDLMN